MSSARQRLLVNGSAEPDAYDTPCWGSFLECFGKCIGYTCLFSCCGCCCNPYKTVYNGYKGIVVRFGRIRDVLEPGMHYINPVSESVHQINMMTHVKSLDSQEVLTKDNIPLTIDGDVFWRRIDAVNSTFSVIEPAYCVDQLAHAALRDVFGHYDLKDCLSHREEVSIKMKELVSDQVSNWGIVIESIRIRDIKIPNHIRDLLASAATAQRESEALLVKSQANVQAARLMREAADQLSTPAAMQIRALETYERLASTEGSKLIFLPADGKIMPTVSVQDK